MQAEPRQLKHLSRDQHLLLAVLVATGLALRLLFHHGRPFDGDELGTLIYLKKPVAFLLTHFIDPWLSMNWYLSGLKVLAVVFGKTPIVLKLPSLLADTCSIALVAALALRVATPRTALAGAALFALNPYLIYYAGVIRAYSMLVMFALAALVLAYDWMEKPSWLNGCGVAAASLGALLVQPVAIWAVLFVAIMLAVQLARTASVSLREALREAVTLVVPGVPAAVLVAAAYMGIASPMADYAVKVTYTPPTPVNYLPFVLTDFFAPGYFVLPSLAVLAAGLYLAVRYNARLLALAGLVPWLLLGASLQGVSMRPWAMSRFEIVMLPVLLIVAAEALQELGRSWRGTALAVLVFAATWIPSAKSRFDARVSHPVDQLVAHLSSSLQKDDALVALDSWALLRLLEPFEGRWQRMPDYAAQPDDHPSGKLVLVSAGEHIATDAQATRLGEFQITEYAEPTRRARVEHVYRDLRRSAGGRTTAGLVEYYDTLLKLQPAAAPGDDRVELTRLYYECLQRTRKGMFPLPQELGIPYEALRSR